VTAYPDTPAGLLWAAIGLWLCAASLYGVILTVSDKRRAVRGGRRVPEKKLFLWGFLGGAGAMWLTMWMIRHKTRHARFMLGLPAMLLLHAAGLWALISYLPPPGI